MQKNLFSTSSQNLLPRDGEVMYFQEFFSKSEADYFFKKLQHIEWKQEPIKIFGKLVMQPRLTALYGNADIPYSYSGIKMDPYPWEDFLLEMKVRVEEETRTNFTHVLLNYYRDGKDSMGWHRDNESILGKNPTIASLSFGETRDFHLRHYIDKKNKIKIPLEHGSLLVMSGTSQEFWQHQIPKTSKELGPRINLTFRKIK
jgi:alkylated DNA repair dioxygenase AlkB